MPFLDEAEWSDIDPLLEADKQAIVLYRKENNASIMEARKMVRGPANLKFEEITGFKGVHFDIIHHHRLSKWGDECPQCHHLLRTPMAKLCANCGREKSD